MTAEPEPADAAAPASPRRGVLDEDGLDRLDLVLGGWLPRSAIAGVAGPDDVVLTDAENTPLARVRPGPDGVPVVEPLADIARGGGPHWDRQVRLSAAELRERLGPAGNGPAAVAFVIDELPARTDVDRLVSAATRPGIDAVVVVVPVTRRRRPPDEAGWSGLTRAAWATADAMAAAAPGRPVVRLAIPWPVDAAPDLSAGGIGTVHRVAEGRSDAESAAIAAARASGVDLDAIYPPASTRELRLARRGGPDSGPGAVVFFTGLSGSGKSTIARALADELADDGPRRVTLLDGDEVRQHLSRGLGFDAESREINIDRIAWVAALVAEHGGIAVAAPIAPFDRGRREARAMAEARGAAFLLVWVDTPLAVCEARDRKGLYARARAGEVAEFTGISSPYEPPRDAEVIIDTTRVEVPEAVRRIREALDAKLAAT